MLEAGQKVGKLTLIERTAGTKTPKTNASWTARCECGTVKTFTEWNITSAKTRSCGCGHALKKSNDISEALNSKNWER